MKRVFIAATKQNDGKTTVSLGLIRNFQARFKKVGFIKPIGQRYLEEEGLKVDEDSVFIEKACGIKSILKDMSPIAVERGFTERYIDRPDKGPITKQIKDSFRRISKGKELVIVEGTGHAGVGSVFDHSNATVAKLLGCKVIIISSGGIGRPIDEIALNKALFEKEGVKVLGVIVNKVLPAKFDRISRLVKKGFTRKGIRVLGVIPYNPLLSLPTIEQILEETDFRLLCGKEYVEQYISSVLVGAMRPKDAEKFIVDDALLITPGDREDMIEVALNCARDDQSKKPKVSGIILSGGFTPQGEVLDLLREARIPVLSADTDTYDVATTVHDLTVKMRPCDTLKVDAAVKLIKENVDFDAILSRI